MRSESEIEQWVDNALAGLGLVGRKLDRASTLRLQAEVEVSFVVGTPRVWWLGFRTVHQSVPIEESKLSLLVDDPGATGHFIPDPDSQLERAVAYRLSAREVEAVVQECPFFEYYFLGHDREFLIAETDHNQFVVASSQRER